MNRLRCLFAKDDALHNYAERFMRSASFFSMNAGARDLLNFGTAQVAKLHTDGDFQVELVTVAGGFYIPKHVHPNMDSIEVNVSGAVRFIVEDEDVFAGQSDDRLLQRMQHKGLRIDHGQMHHGQVLPTGAVFLSFQRWLSEPTSVGLDYVGVPLSADHEIQLNTRPH